jgi:lactate dehydrogenase-like 2-hydroxyacid dehydrogenase
MIISTFRHLPWCIGAATSGDPAAFATCHRDATARSHNLRGHALGIVGLGNVGQQIAARCRHGFGMEIHYYDVAPISPDVEAALGGDIARHPSLESLIRASDCVVLCAPAVPGGTNAPPLIGTEQLSWFRDGGRLVNVARGSLVDDEAVADALDAGKLLSAALDVHPNEPHVSARLRALAVAGRVMLTCHNAGGTVETHRGFEELSMRNVMAVLSGAKPITPVNLESLR